MGDVPIHWEDDGRISPSSGTLDNGAASKTAGRWELGLPTFDIGSGRGRIGGSGYVYTPPP